MRSKQRGFTITELGIVLFILVGIGAMIGTLCVAVHFISKFW